MSTPHILVSWRGQRVLAVSEDPEELAQEAVDLGWGVEGTDNLYAFVGEDCPRPGGLFNLSELGDPDPSFKYEFEGEVYYLNPPYPDEDDLFYDLDHAYDGEKR